MWLKKKKKKESKYQRAINWNGTGKVCEMLKFKKKKQTEIIDHIKHSALSGDFMYYLIFNNKTYIVQHPVKIY